jgi:hypothetical protein
MTTKAHFPLMALGAVLLMASAGPAFGQAPAPRAARPAAKPAAPRPAPAPAATTPVTPTAPVAATPKAPADPRVTIALFGENQVQGSLPWMRTALAATFENKLVQARRFRVVSMANKGFAEGQAADSANALLDPTEVIRLGKQVQARYALVLRQIRAQRNKSILKFVSKDTLDISIQAQVVDLQTNILSESISYEAKLSTGFKAAAGAPEGVVLPQADFGPVYGEAIAGFADEFITKTAAILMPLEALVVDVAPTEVMLAAGSELGLASGAEFEVMREGKSIPMPDGSVIKRTSKAGRLRLTRVESRVSYAEILETYSESQAKDPAPDANRLQAMMLARYVPAVAAAPAQKKK